MNTIESTAPAPTFHPAINDGEAYAGLARDPITGQWRHLYARIEPIAPRTFNGHIKAATEGGYEVAAIHELAIIRANCPEFKDLEEWVWSSTPFAGDERYAWMQGFYNGYQNGNHKDYDYVAVAVRREPV